MKTNVMKNHRIHLHVIAALVCGGVGAAVCQAAPDAVPTTREEQQTRTPAEVLADLMAGNARFVANKPLEKDWQAQVRASTQAQYPKAVILSCLDSRVPVEVVFDQGIGDVFVARVAGNVEGEQTLGSMEFATKVAGARLVMVLGHEACGAVKGAIDGARLGHLTGLLDEIKPAVECTACDGERTSKNRSFVNEVVRNNVLRTLTDIRKRSEVIRELEKTGKIRLLGACYSLHDGKVTVLDETGKSGS